eukprot:ANDGO_05766.mRNA.1 Bidirectional sugar transporter SWEET1
MSALSLVFSLAGACTASFLFYSPWKSICEIDRTQDTKGMSALPFAFMVASNVTYTLYSVIARDLIVFIVNATSVPLLAHYFLVIFANSLPEQRKKIMIFLIFLITTICYSFGIYGFTRSENQSKVDTDISGIVGSVMVVALYGAPILNIHTAFRRVSLDPIPLKMGLAALINSALWFLYGMISSQPFIAWPNSMGMIVGTAQCVSFFVLKARGAVSTVQSTKSAAGSGTQSDSELGDFQLPHQQLEDDIHSTQE